MFSSVLSAVLTLLCLGLAGGLILVFAAKFLNKPEDPRIAQVQQCLPGVNCGACGYAGCADYAKAVALSGAPVNKCVPGGQKTADAVAAVMGAAPTEAAAPRRAVVACQGTGDHRQRSFAYEGISSCAAANMMYSGPTDCRYGCLGYGDCTRACKFDAIRVENGVAKVDPDKCTGCGACAEACPDHLIRVVSQSQAAMVFCANHDRGVVTRQNCSIGCIGCGKCVRGCPVGAITLDNNLADIDMEKCIGCGKCASLCPVGAIHLPNAPTTPAVKAPVDPPADKKPADAPADASAKEPRD